MPEEWPIAAVRQRTGMRLRARRAAAGCRPFGVDFFLNPAERLTEQERALMTAMLHCLVGDIAGEIRAALPAGWAGAERR